MILCNTSKKEIEGRHDGKFYSFKAGERRNFSENNDYDRDLINLLYHTLAGKGLVKWAEGTSDADIKKIEMSGLKARIKQLDDLARNFVTHNKERLSMKLAEMPPTDFIADCLAELEQLNEELAQADPERTRLLKAYMANNRMDKAQEGLDAMPKIEIKGGQPEIKRGRPRAVSLT